MEVIMANKKKSNPNKLVSDFAGFDAKPLDHLWKVYPKREPEKAVLVFAHVFMDARRLALMYFKDEQGLALSYDQITAEVMDEGQVAVAEGTFFLAPGTPLGVELFQATRATDREGARRGFGFRKREPVALEGGRESKALSGGVQAHGQEVVLSEGGRPGEAPRSGAQGREEPTLPGGAGEGTSGDPSVGASTGSPSEGGRP